MNVDTGEFRAITAAVGRAYDSGQDTFANIFHAGICFPSSGGSTDTEILDVIREMISARMEVGLPAEAWFVS